MSEELDEDIVRLALVLMMVYKDHHYEVIPERAELLIQYIKTGEVKNAPRNG